MTEKELREIFRRGECLSLETMRLYHEGKLNSKSAHEVEKHVLACTLCAAAMDGNATKKVIDINKVTTNIHRRLKVYMNTPPAPTFLQRFGAIILIASVIIIGITAGIWYANSSKLVHDSAQQSPPPITPKSMHTSQHPEVSAHHNDNAASTVALAPANKVADVEITEQSMSPAPNTDTASGLGERVSPIVSAVSNTAPLVVDTKLPDEPRNTRTSGNHAIRIKSVVVYPPVTHVEGGKRNTGGDGQLGGSNSGTKGLELDEMPTYPGGNEALKKFILANFKSPVMSTGQLKRYSTGFMLQINAKTGAIKFIEQTYPLSPEIDAELMRVMKLLPSWNPGKKRATVDVMIGVTLE